MRPNPSRSRFVLPVLLLGALLSFGGRVTAARADDRNEDPESGSTFGRVRYLEGGLTLQRTGQGEFADATVNDPIAPGDTLASEDGRSELGLSDGSTVWLDRGTRVDVRNLADIDGRYESTNLFALEGGAIRIEAPEPESKSKTYRVDTEAGSIYLLSGGSFRIETEEGVTTLYSFRGVAELSGDDGSVLVRSGERGSVQPGRPPSEPRRFNTARLDDFDRFCEGRQAAYLRRDKDEPVGQVVDEVPYEVHPYMNELSYYGSWRQVPDYGWVWRPVYSGSWGPYVNGYWSWCRTGWVWVSNDPWGWAPYHYGRWDFGVDIGWFWIPGRVWSGAWVSFAVGPSHIGWCPLNYYNRPVFQDVTIVNVVNVNVTRLQPRGWRFVPTDQFTNPRSPRTAVRVDRLPRGTDVVITSRLPRFDPREVAGRPERGVHFVDTVRQTRAPLPVTVDRNNKPQSFRAVEKAAPGPRGRRGVPAAEPRDSARVQRARPGVRNESPGTGPRPSPPRSDVSGRPRGVPGGPQHPSGREPNPPRERVAPPARTQGQGRGGGAPQARPPEPPRDSRSRPEAGNQGRGQAPPDRVPPRAEQRRPGGHSDEAAERLFDGVRGESARPRTEAQRVQPPPARPEMKPQRPERPPQARPAPPSARPQPKPEQGQDKDKGR
jgi:uncharacterized protein DUF6600/FecR-like protein